jgi:hypothetical protein
MSHFPAAALFLVSLLPMAAQGGDFAGGTVQWNGFALVRPQTASTGVPLDDDSLSAQLQVGIDWRPSVLFGAHVHLLARNDADGSRRGRVGIVEAFAEQNIRRGTDRIHLMEGAFFLPTSRENVDSLWETPYTITSSALNTWMGEEFRPVGIDAAYTRRLPRSGSLNLGGTLFSGNDTFGALPIDRGWMLNDHWALLGEHIPVTSTLYTSVSAETDHRLGWSARGRWYNDAANVQFTRIDNRADALRYGELFNWATRFNILGGDYRWNDWMFVGETGWGTTAIQGRRRFSSPIRASYALVSRRIANFRATVRVDDYEHGHVDGNAVTAALFWEPHPRLRTGVEAITADGEESLAVELRYRF